MDATVIFMECIIAVSTFLALVGGLAALYNFNSIHAGVS